VADSAIGVREWAAPPRPQARVRSAPLKLRLGLRGLGLGLGGLGLKLAKTWVWVIGEGCQPWEPTNFNLHPPPRSWVVLLALARTKSWIRSCVVKVIAIRTMIYTVFNEHLSFILLWRTSFVLFHSCLREYDGHHQCIDRICSVLMSEQNRTRIQKLLYHENFKERRLRLSVFY